MELNFFPWKRTLFLRGHLKFSNIDFQAYILEGARDNFTRKTTCLCFALYLLQGSRHSWGLSVKPMAPDRSVEHKDSDSICSLFHCADLGHDLELVSQ